jgi:lambda family phage portal protein
MKPTILDRAITQIAPQIGLKRLQARVRAEVLGGLPGALQPAAVLDDRNSELPSSPGPGGGLIRRIWGSIGRDARADTLYALKYDRANSRDLARTSPIAVGAINTNIDRVVGTGLALSAQPNARVLGWTAEQVAEWKTTTQNEFSLWADSTDCDITRQQTFYQLQDLVLRAVLESGDAFSLLPDAQPTRMQPYRLRVQVLEADRVGNPENGADTPTVAGGIEIDATGGAPKRVYVYKTHPGGMLPQQTGSMYAGDWVDMVGSTGRRRILHHFRKKRPGQPRGLPYLAPIIDCIKQISRYTEAEIMAAVITSYFTVFIEAPGGNTAPVFGAADGAGGVGDEIGLGMGAIVGLAPGEKVQTANPARPNPNFEPFILAVIKQMGMALSLPYELLVKQFNSSYSASKAALLDAWVYFRSVRTWLALSFCQPVYETWLAEAVAIGRISAPGFFTDPLMRWAYTRAAWPGDSMGSINPKDEVKAYADAIDARLMTRERAEWELFGTDFNDTFDPKQNEEQRLKAADMLPVPKAGAAAPKRAADPVDPDADPAADDTDPEGTKS